MTPAATRALAWRDGHSRWIVCGLLLAATTINYVDRQVLGILAPDLQRSIGWSEIEYGYIVTSFQAAYAIGLLLAGRLMDVSGVRLGYAAAVVFWSVAAMAHGLARSAFGFGVARFALGLGEGGNFPVAIKAVAEWFPRRERAFATGIFNSGSNAGAIVAPLTVPSIALAWGWPAAFVATGAIGFLWVAAWLAAYESPRRRRGVTRAELAYIESGDEAVDVALSWRALVRHRETWAFALGKFLTDPIWWFYLYWLPKFFSERHGLTLSTVGAPLVAIYLIADAGSVGGGWLSSSLIARGWPLNRARKTAMLACALAVTPIVFASAVDGVWAAVALVGLAAAGHQGWSANMFTLASDLFPRGAVATVVGIGGMAGAIGGMLIAAVTGYVLELTGSYLSVFIAAGSTYLVALAVVHALSPTLAPARIAGTARS